jgi:SAM-dependent methyltransferase
VTAVESDYDDFAVIYGRYWGPRYAAAACDTLDVLLAPRIAAGAKVLDLCCGAGQISAVLAARGFDVMGLDASAALLQLARTHAPQVRFQRGDARGFWLGETFQAVICLNDSLNHLLTLDELRQAFQCVSACLGAGGLFVLDLNLAYKYETGWSGAMSIIDDDAVCAIHCSSDIAARRARFDAAVFRPSGAAWARRDVRLLQSWYPVEEVVTALGQAGFEEVQVTGARGDPLPGSRVSKACFSCSKR